MIITLLDGARAIPAYGDVLPLSGAEFLDMMADEESCPSVACSSEDDKKAGSGFITARYIDYATSKKLEYLHEESATSVFVYDIDNMTADEIAVALPLWIERSAVLYTTYKHQCDNPRYRLLVELDTDVSNYAKDPFTGLYLGVAAQLKVKADPKTLDRARFFFGPQHHVDFADHRERHRFTGPPIEVGKVVPAETKTIRENSFEVAGDRPSKVDVRAMAKRFRKSRNQRMRHIASALEAVLRGEAFAPLGSIHNTSMELSFELVREYRNLDGQWFADNYLATPWETMGTADYDKKLDDWLTLVVSAKEKHAERDAEKEKEVAAAQGRLTEEQITRAENLRGRWIMSYRGAYFIYSPVDDYYKGPYKSSEVAVVVRDELNGIKDVSEFELTRGGPVLKSAVKLNHEYGTTADGAVYFPTKPPTAYDSESNSVCIKAYKWIEWEPKFHQIADELLHVISGSHYAQFEAYLTQFRNLDQPLPALTLVGPKGCWKSRICSILSRFWTTRHAESPGRAEQIMTRFNEHLAVNPVIWSDEQLAITQYGKPQPEAYRESITSKHSSIEFKGVSGLMILKGAVRHVIAVNNDEKIFSAEVDADSIYATMERFLLMYTNMDTVQNFEKKWAGTPEMQRLREGDSLLEHVRWLEENTQQQSNGRLFVQPHTDAQILLRARFSDDLLLFIWQVALDALMGQGSYMRNANRKILPLIVQDGKLYFSAQRLQDLWSSSKATAGSMMKKPTSRRINTIMEKASFKKLNGDKYLNYWEVDVNTFKTFLEVSEITGTYEFEQKCVEIFKEKI